MELPESNGSSHENGSQPAVKQKILQALKSVETKLKYPARRAGSSAKEKLENVEKSLDTLEMEYCKIPRGVFGFEAIAIENRINDCRGEIRRYMDEPLQKSENDAPFERVVDAEELPDYMDMHEIDR